MVAGDLLRVLIVEEEPNDRGALANVLAKRKDIEAFDSAENILEAIDKLHRAEYDVVRLNSLIPETSEFKLLESRDLAQASSWSGHLD
jgi:DNA-binding NarL/FixJ family response regulator